MGLSHEQHPEHEAREVFARALKDLAEHPPRIPRATYRLQLSAEFTLDAARGVLDYFAGLGIGDVYLSPVLQARSGSSHGYDVVDPGRVDRALGGDVAFERFCAEARALGLGVIVDIVPNHMGIGDERNAWWNDVLAHGPASSYAGHFDIEWSPPKPELVGKVLLPVLPTTYGEALESGLLQVRYESGAFMLHCNTLRLPLAPDTWSQLLEGVELEDPSDAHELESIALGLRNLPERTGELPDRMKQERARAAVHLSHRLAVLFDRSVESRRRLEEKLRGINGFPRGPLAFEVLHALLERQSWRLAYWRVASEEINYRRFFDINELAAIRMDVPEAFERTHRHVLELVDRGLVTGLRIDHPDGMLDPAGYFAALQQSAFLARAARLCDARGPRRAEVLALVAKSWQDLPERPRAVFVVAEKILSANERVPPGWSVDGTTGYDFTARVGEVLTDPAGEEPLTRLWRAWSATFATFTDAAYEARQLILESSLASELSRLEHQLERLVAKNRRTRDFTHGLLTQALTAVIASFPKYRTYVTRETEQLSDDDRAAVEQAIRRARRRHPMIDGAVFELLRRVLLLDPPDDDHGWRDFVLRFQQLTAPVTAKGVEDTAFYRFHRLVSLNEVGSDPSRFSISAETFHHDNAEAGRLTPWTFLATSTHDTKRGEDVRSRVGVLAELAPRWAELVEQLSSDAAPHKTRIDGELAPTETDEYLLYQTLVGTLPVPPAGVHESYVARILAYMSKATREAKEHTSWTNPNEAYDAAIERFVRRCLAPGAVLEKLTAFSDAAAQHGYWTSLSQTLLRLTCPGVPDTYQGTELWSLSLVDPDNRRPVDFERHATVLREIRTRRSEGAGFVRELVSRPEDGRIKLFVTHVALDARRRNAPLFDGRGSYTPLVPHGAHAAHVLAFLRRAGRAQAAVVVPRFVTHLGHGHPKAPMGDVWTDDAIELPNGLWRDAFTDQVIRSNGSVALREVLGTFPVALLERVEGS